MTTYVDTSVWLALLGREPGYEVLARWLAEAGALCCADWTQVEMASGLGIKQRRGDIDAPMQQAILAVFDDMLGQNVTVIALMPADVRAAYDLCRDADSGLRAGDALHLAVARRVGCRHFFSLDKTLNRNAVQAGMRLVEV